MVVTQYNLIMSTQKLKWSWFAVTPMIFVSLLVFIIPVFSFLLISFGDSFDTLSFVNYKKIIETPIYKQIIFNTFNIAFLVTVTSIIFSYPIVYLLVNASERLRKFILILVLLPFWTSALVRTTAWIVILQRNGILNEMLLFSGLINEPISFIYNFSGVLIGMTHVLMPFVIFPLYASYKNIDASLIEAAESLGSRSLQTIKYLILPLTMPGVIAGAIIVFMSAIGYYITPALMGGPKQTMIAMLIENNINRTLNWELAAALSAVLLIFTLTLFVIFQRYFGFDKLLTDNSQKGVSQNHKNDNSPSRFIMYFMGMVVCVFLIAPILIVFPMSLSASPFLEFPPQEYSFKWYESFFSDTRWIRGFWNSLIAAFVTIVISLPIGTLAAIGINEMKRKTRLWLETFFILPMVVPVIIFAISLFYFIAPLKLNNSPITLGIAHSILAMPFVFLTVSASLKNFNKNLEYAAYGLGASWLTMFRKVMLPIITPGIIAGGIFSFIQSFDDVVLALFLTNIKSRTLPRIMFEGVAHEIDPTIVAISGILIILTIILFSVNIAFSSEKSK